MFVLWFHAKCTSRNPGQDPGHGQYPDHCHDPDPGRGPGPGPVLGQDLAHGEEDTVGHGLEGEELKVVQGQDRDLEVLERLTEEAVVALLTGA